MVHPHGAPPIWVSLARAFASWLCPRVCHPPPAGAASHVHGLLTATAGVRAPSWKRTGPREARAPTRHPTAPSYKARVSHSAEGLAGESLERRLPPITHSNTETCSDGQPLGRNGDIRAPSRTEYVTASPGARVTPTDLMLRAKRTMQTASCNVLCPCGVQRGASAAVLVMSPKP